MKLTAMAFDRSKWIDKVRNVLSGALGEYCQIIFAKASGVGVEFVDHWEREVSDHIQTLSDLLDKDVTKGKSNFDRIKAFQEAFQEATLSKDQVTAAKNKIDKMAVNKKQRTDIYNAVLPTQKFLYNMLAEHGKGLKISGKVLKG